MTEPVTLGPLLAAVLMVILVDVTCDSTMMLEEEGSKLVELGPDGVVLVTSVSVLLVVVTLDPV